jgi:hypothetical protein
LSVSRGPQFQAPTSLPRSTVTPGVHSTRHQQATINNIPFDTSASSEMDTLAYKAVVEASLLVARASDRNRTAIQEYREHCTYDTCPLSASYWGYRPSLGANLAFLILFGISTLSYIGQGFLNKAWLGFTIAMVCGCALEVIGYVGRVLAYNDGFTEVCDRDLDLGARPDNLRTLS